jgi:ComF family protein
MWQFIGTAINLIGMKIKDLVRKVLFFASVPKCVSCKERLEKAGMPFCNVCYEKYKNNKSRNCSVCSERLYLCSCSNKYLKSHYIHKLIKLYRYLPDTGSPANNVIYSLKRDNRRDVVEFLANELVVSLKNQFDNFDGVVFTNIPRREAAIKKYGYDHAERLARSLSKKLSCEYMSVLKSKTKRAQKKLDKLSRVKNVNFDYKVKGDKIKGKTVFIVDDIVTSGASMGRAGMLIHALGAKKIIGVSVAVAYKDETTFFDIKDRFKG